MKITLIMLESLNGYIAKSQADDLMWGGKADKQNFRELTKNIGTVIMGRSSFEALGKRALVDRHNIVLTRNPDKYTGLKSENLEFSAEAPAALVARLASTGLTEVALIGGSQVNSLFLAAGLIDEIIITIAPRLFIGEVQLFSPEVDFDVELQLLGLTNLGDSTLNLHYKVVK